MCVRGRDFSANTEFFYHTYSSRKCARAENIPADGVALQSEPLFFI